MRKIGLVLAVLCGMVSGDAAARDNSGLAPLTAEGTENSELSALVGLRVPPVSPFKKQGEIPGWHSLGSFSTTAFNGYGENGYIGKEGGFVIIHLDEDKTRTVIDARVLPLELLGMNFDSKDGMLIWRKNYSVGECKKNGLEDGIIGLVRPEKGKEGCLHFSRQVKMAWRVNTKTGKLEDVSPKGLSCFIPDGEDECY